MTIKYSCYLCFFLVIFSGLSMTAQQSNSPVEKLAGLYESVLFEQVIEMGDSLLHQSKQPLSADDYLHIHRYLGLAHYNLGNEDSARVHFLSMLSLNPAAELDPVNTSPKILNFFEQIRSEYRVLLPKTSQPSFIRYVYATDPRPNAVWRSAILPGWGQLYKKQPRYAILFGGGFWGSLAATGIVYFREKDLKKNYEAATVPQDISEKYDRYNRWFKTRQVLMWLTAGMWALNVVDAGWRKQLQPGIAAGRDGLALRLVWRF